MTANCTTIKYKYGMRFNRSMQALFDAECGKRGAKYAAVSQCPSGETGGSGAVLNFEAQIVWNIIIYLCVESKLCKHAAVIIYLRQLFEWLTSDVAIWCECYSVQQHGAAAGRVYIAICQSLSVSVLMSTIDCRFRCNVNLWMQSEMRRKFLKQYQRCSYVCAGILSSNESSLQNCC